MAKTVRLTDAEMKAVEEFQADENINFSDLVRDALQFVIEELGYIYPRAKGRGHTSPLIEALKTSTKIVPEDLS